MLFRSFFTVSFFISISRILGFIRDILIAKYVGVSMLSDAFFAAFRLPNFFRRIFAEGAFNSAFVPIFIEKLSDKKSEKDDLLHSQKEFASNIFSLLLYTLFLFVIIFQIFMPFFMKILFPGFFTDPEKSTLLINFSRITIFYLIFISLVSLFSGILNSLNKFAAPAASPIILNCTLIASIFVLGPLLPNYGYALSCGVAVAGVLQLAFVGYFAARKGFLFYPKFLWIFHNFTPLLRRSPQSRGPLILRIFHNFTPLLRRSPQSRGLLRNPNEDQKERGFWSLPDDIRKFFRKLLPGIIGANVMQINLLVDSIFASMIAGAVSYLYYADRVNQLPLAMIGIAIGIALLPNLSRKIKAGEIEEANKLQNTAIEAGLILVAPATLALTVLAFPIISTLFERGAFAATESKSVGMALMFYSFGLPSYVLVKILEPAFFARSNTKTPMKIAICCLINNAVFNCIFYFCGFGYVGIILSSVISSYLNLSLLFWNLISHKNFSFEADFAKKLFKIFIASGLMALALELAKRMFFIEGCNKFLVLSLIIAVGLLIYSAASYFLGSFKILFQVARLKKKKSGF